MHQFLPGYAKSLAEAIGKLSSDSKCNEVTFSNGSGVKLTRDDAYGQAKKQKGAKLIGTQAYNGHNFLIFAP